MKKIVIILFIFLSATALFAVEKNEEFRSTWIITRELIDSTNSTEENKAKIRDILDNHKRANMNAVLWQARQNGTSYYISTYEPWGKYSGYKDPGFDPLAYAVQEAHARGLEIHAWFNTFEARDRVPGSPSYEHPEWICRDRDGNPMTSNIALSPGLAEVRDYLIKVAMEIVTNYDIDGFHLDYVRWNEFSDSPESKSMAKIAETYDLPDGFITEGQIKDLEENASGRYLYDYLHPYSDGIPEGFTNWEEWWRWSVTEFVRTLHDSIQAIKPWVRLSPAALGKYNWSGWQGYGIVYQDAALWFNEGYIDQLTPMHYHWLTGNEFYDMLTGACPDCWRQYIQDGINDGRLYTVGPPSYKLDEDNLWYRHPDIIEKSRRVSWVDGFQFFSYGDWEDRNYWDEARSILFPYKAKIRATGLIDDNAPDNPTLELSMLDSLNVQVAVQPPESSVESFWTAIYRSTDSNLEKDRDDIIEISFGNEPYVFQDRFTGNQDYNGSYHYFATTFDRFWNESDISESYESDPVYSAPPIVESSNPESGDTVSVNSSIEILFSKSMDETTIESSIVFSPSVEIEEYIWSNSKSLLLKIKGDLIYSTDYTMTMDPGAKDINGVALDGNGDGIPGDSFELEFRTKAIDDQGPVVIQTYPHMSSQTLNFTIDDIITVVYDEYIDHTSVNDCTIVLMANTEFVEIEFALTDMREKSILCIQPTDELMSDSYYSLKVDETITDTLGNIITSPLELDFKTDHKDYTEIVTIESFLSTSNWASPDYSGSTVGIIKPNTEFLMTNEAYLPNTSVRQRIAATLRYEWDVSADEFLIREYLSQGSPRDIEFDTTYVLQSYVFGDGSRNTFRFCIDEGDGISWNDHEVSQWYTIDWYGWRLIEWNLGDPEETGEWIGNSVLDGTKYRIDSYQLGHEENAELSGTIYFDDLRIVKKEEKYIGIENEDTIISQQYKLHQNYPNPFNPTTIIPFDIAHSGHVSLKVYNVLGQRVATLIDKTMFAGHYEVNFDASHLSSGFYFYILESRGKILRQQMLLLK